MEIPSELYTWNSLISLAGSAGMAFIVPVVLGQAFTWIKGVWRVRIALLVAIGLQIAAMLSAEGEPTLKAWAVALANGFLVTATSLGFNTMTKDPGAINAAGADGWRAPWL